METEETKGLTRVLDVTVHIRVTLQDKGFSYSKRESRRETNKDNCRIMGLGST